MRRFQGIFIVAVVVLPAIIARVTAATPAPFVSLLMFGAAVVGASFMLAWAAETAEMDIAGGLAIAVLALIAVLPEYAVDLYFAYTSGHDHAYAAYAAANMTGSNRLLMGLGWPLVVLLGIMAARKTSTPMVALELESGSRVELGFLMVAGIIAFVAPITSSITVPLAVALLAWFGYYLFRVAQGEVEEPELIGLSASLAMLPPRTRRIAIVSMFTVAAIVILLSAQPFADSLVATGKQFGIDEFLLVQWLAPLASEAPEFIVAIVFAVRGNAANAVSMLISAKVNQWTLLIGSLPIARAIGGGGWSGLPLDSRQFEEILLTAAQTLMGVALILALRFSRTSAWLLLGLFVIQFAVPGTTGRLAISALYGVIALGAFIKKRDHILPTLRAPFASA